MSSDPKSSAIRDAAVATAQPTTVDDVIAAAIGMTCIPEDETIVEPEPTENVMPDFLSRTGSGSIKSFNLLQDHICEQNA